MDRKKRRPFAANTPACSTAPRLGHSNARHIHHRAGLRRDRFSKLSEDEARRLCSEAAVMVLLEPERTLSALPKLLSRKEDRERAIQILERGLALEGITKEQRDMGNRIMELLQGSNVPGSKGKTAVKTK